MGVCDFMKYNFLQLLRLSTRLHTCAISDYVDKRPALFETIHSQPFPCFFLMGRL